MQIEINPKGDNKIAVTSPYNQEFVDRAKQRGGRWDGGREAWIFDARDEEAIAELLREIYGTDGRAPVELVDVRVSAEEYHDYDKIVAFGRTLARRRNRDSKPQLGEGVVVVSGKFAKRGGSRKNPRISDDELEGMILEVRDVPRPIVDAEIDRVAARVDSYDDAEPDSWAARRRDELAQSIEIVRTAEIDDDAHLAAIRHAVAQAVDAGVPAAKIREAAELAAD